MFCGVQGEFGRCLAAGVLLFLVFSTEKQLQSPNPTPPLSQSSPPLPQSSPSLLLSSPPLLLSPFLSSPLLCLTAVPVRVKAWKAKRRGERPDRRPSLSLSLTHTYKHTLLFHLY